MDLRDCGETSLRLKERVRTERIFESATEACGAHNAAMPYRFSGSLSAKRSRWLGALCLLAALVASVVGAAGALRVVSLEHDWGYYLIQRLVGQMPDSDQYSGAMFIQFVEVTAVGAGIVFGYMKQQLRGAWWWRPVAILPPIAIFAYVVGSSGETIASTLLNPETWTNWTVFACWLFGTMVISELLFVELSLRTKPWRVLLPGLVALAVAAAAGLADLELGSWKGEFIFDWLNMFAAGTWAACWCRSKTMSTATAAVFITMMPFVLFNLCNIFYDTLTLKLLSADNLRALLSAAIITASALSAGCAGAWAGLRLRKLGT